MLRCAQLKPMSLTLFYECCSIDKHRPNMSVLASKIPVPELSFVYELLPALRRVEGVDLFHVQVSLCGYLHRACIQYRAPFLQ